MPGCLTGLPALTSGVVSGRVSFTGGTGVAARGAAIEAMAPGSLSFSWTVAAMADLLVVNYQAIDFVGLRLKTEVARLTVFTRACNVLIDVIYRSPRFHPVTRKECWIHTFGKLEEEDGANGMFPPYATIPRSICHACLPRLSKDCAKFFQGRRLQG